MIISNSTRFIVENDGSRALPGFCLNVIFYLCLIISGLVLSIGVDRLDFEANDVSLIISKANASAAMDPGVKPQNYSNSYKRHIKKALVSNQENILKLNGYSILATFKSPELVRQDLPTTIWQYRSSNCVLDIYFVSKTQQPERLMPAHFEMRSRVNDDLDDKSQCLASILETSAPQMVSVSAFYKSYLD